VSVTLATARKLEAERLRRAVDKAVGEVVDAKTPSGVSHDDRERLRGLPALVKGGLGSAIHGTVPGPDAHLDTLG
jgi:hypothetical protein